MPVQIIDSGVLCICLIVNFRMTVFDWLNSERMITSRCDFSETVMLNLPTRFVFVMAN